MIDTYPVSSPSSPCFKLFKYSPDIAKDFRGSVVFHLLEYVDFTPVVWISQVRSGHSDPELSQHVRAQHTEQHSLSLPRDLSLSMSIRHDQARNVIF